MLASDTTILAVKGIVYLFFIAISVGALPGLFSLGVFLFGWARRHWRTPGVILGLISMGAGVAGLLFVGLVGSWDFRGWVAASAPLIIGICAVAIWTRGVFFCGPPPPPAAVGWARRWRQGVMTQRQLSNWSWTLDICWFMLMVFWLFAGGWLSVALISAATICGIAGSLFASVYWRRSRQKETPSRDNNTA